MRAANTALKGEPQMRSTFFGLQIGQSGLGTAQFGLDVTSHNIANAETAGFTRQRIVQTAIVPATGFGRALPPQSQLRVGVGTVVREHDQIRSAFLDRRFRTENTNAAYWTTRSQEMSYLQSFFDSINEETSINHTIQNFFGAINILAGNPVDGAPRTLVRDAGLELVQQFNVIFNGLVDLQTTQSQAIEVKVGEINRIALEIVNLNKAIYLHEITGHHANDLRDERNLLVDELSTLIDVDYRVIPERDNDGNLTGFEHFELRIAGRVLVHHDMYSMLGVIEEPNVIPGAPAIVTPVWVKKHDEFMMGLPTRPPGEAGLAFTQIRLHDGSERWIRTTHLNQLERVAFDNPLYVQGGQILALMNMRDGIGTEGIPKGVPYYIEMMNNLARSLVQEVNAVHRQGWTDHPLGSETGINFFHIDTAVFENRETGERITLNSNNQWVDGTGSIITIDMSNPETFPEGFTAMLGHFEQVDDDGRVIARITFNRETNQWGRQVGNDFVPEDPQIDISDPSTFPEGFTHVADIAQITAQNIRLSDAIMENAANVAASSEEIRRGFDETGAPIYLQRGNNNNMRALHELFALRRDLELEVNGNLVIINSFDSFATSIRHDVGSTTSLALAASRNGVTLITAMSNQRDAVAGVSLDEEMVSLIKFQHAYSGAARVITAMDDALDRLINGTGRVGL